MTKCPVCKKKLSRIEKTIKCRCDKAFCAKHRQSENHNCSYDYSKDKVCLKACVKEKIQQI